MIGADTTRTVASGTLFIDGTSITSSTINLFATAKIPSSGQALLNIGNFTFKRTSPLFIKTQTAEEAEGVGGLGSLFGGLDIAGGGGGGGGSIEQLSIAKPFGLVNFGTLFLQAARQPESGIVPLNVQGFSGVVGPDSLAYYRNPDIISDGYFPKRRTAFLFASSERNCSDGSLYKFDNNVNDNSQDYGFKLYASGWRNQAGLPHIPESGFFQTSDRFPASSLTGSGVSRFKGTFATPSYFGTVLMQSGSPSIHDQHRITPKGGHVDASGNFTPPRRGVSTSFWMKRKGPAPGYIPTSSAFGVKSVLGNCKLSFGDNHATSGQWSMYYAGHNSNVKASGNSPFNSFKSLIVSNSAKRGVGNTESDALGGLIPFVNTTAGGRTSHALERDDDENLIIEQIPDLMLPLDDDRWYFINYWIDTELYKSFIRVASPAKGLPGQSGYMPEIKPITDVSQKWDGYEVKTDTDSIKFKVGGDLIAGAEGFPYNNLGVNLSTDPKQQDEFLIDELVVSNKVCSPTAMEQEFDKKYEFFTKQFYEPQTASLYITGEQDAVASLLTLFDTE